MTRLRPYLVAATILLTLASCGWLAYEVLGPHQRGPLGYYVQDEDPAVHIEFFGKNARSNIVKEFGESDYWFIAFDGEMDLRGPMTAPKHKQRAYEVYGNGDHIRIQAEPVGPNGAYVMTHYTKRKK